MVTVITAYIYRPSISKELKALYRHIISFYRRKREKRACVCACTHMHARTHIYRDRKRERGQRRDRRTWCAIIHISQMAQSREVNDPKWHG
jgi:hypothetical protein